MLEKRLQDEKNLKRLQRISTASEMLKERYDELDYLIKMQSNEKIEEQFCVTALVEQRVHFLQRLYPNFEIHLALENLQIRGDKKGLSKVIDNIVDNGVKYSQNSKTLEIKLQNRLLSIQDFGKGMDEVELLHIFDKYYQSDKNMQGFGIGLNMVKRYCDTNNIELRFVSKPNIGTTVKLNFKN
jgi:signal transduction histidine kinase